MQAPIKERMDIFIPDVPVGLPRRNGFTSVYSGSEGSGKSSLILGLFKSIYRQKLNNSFYMPHELIFIS